MTDQKITEEEKFDLALSRFTSLSTKLTSLKPTYLSTPPKSTAVFDNTSKFNPRLSDTTFISSNTRVSNPSVYLTNCTWDASWSVLIHKLVDRLKVRECDCVTHLDCHDGRWLYEICYICKCNVHGVAEDDTNGSGSGSNLEYEFNQRFHESNLTDKCTYTVTDDLLATDISSTTILFINLTQTYTSKIRRKIANELAYGSPVVVIGGQMGGWVERIGGMVGKLRGVEVWVYYGEDRGGEMEEEE